MTLAASSPPPHLGLFGQICEELSVFSQCAQSWHLYSISLKGSEVSVALFVWAEPNVQTAGIDSSEVNSKLLASKEGLGRRRQDQKRELDGDGECPRAKKEKFESQALAVRKHSGTWGRGSSTAATKHCLSPQATRPPCCQARCQAFLTLIRNFKRCLFDTMLSLRMRK